MFGSIMSLGGSLLGNEFNRKEASKTRAWLEEMSNTAHQREVKDLRTAGLNPILSAHGKGASTPGPSTASSLDLGKSIASGSQASTAKSLSKATIQSTTANARLTNANATIAEMKAQIEADKLRLYKEGKKLLFSPANGGSSNSAGSLINSDSRAGKTLMKLKKRFPNGAIRLSKTARSRKNGSDYYREYRSRMNKKYHSN